MEYLILLILLFLPMSVSAETKDVYSKSFITLERNAMRAGDELFCQELSWQNNIWNLKGADVKEDSIVEQYAVLALDTLTRIRYGNRSYYQLKDNQLFLVGTENNQKVMSYGLPEVQLSYPFSFNDSIQGFFDGAGKFCDRLFVKELGKYKTKFVKLGTLFLPDGTEVSNAGLVMTEKLIVTKTRPMCLGQQIDEDVHLDSIVFHLDSDENVEREIVRRIYVKGYRYPLVEAYSRSKFSNDSMIAKRLLYFPPMEQQERLPLDEENKLVRNNKPDDSLYPMAAPVDLNKDDVSEFSIVVNYEANSRKVYISYHNVMDKKLMLILADIQGRVYKSLIPEASMESVCVDCTGLVSGQYVLNVNIDGQLVKVEKFNVK